MSDTLTTTTTEQTAETERVPFRAGDSFISFNMSLGHANRMHHELVGYWAPTPDGFRTLVKTCCGGAA